MLTEELVTVGVESHPYLLRVFDISEEDYERFTDEDTKYELIDGVLIMHSPATIEHEELFGFNQFLLRGYAERKRLGKVLGSRATLHLATCRNVEPDLLFVSNDNRHRITGKTIEGTADCVIEILSESTREYDLKEKRPLYQQARVNEIWFVDAGRRELLVDTLKGETYHEKRQSTDRFESSVIPGFWLDVSWLWQDPLPDPLTCLLSILES